jgi:hypothetical protein
MFHSVAEAAGDRAHRVGQVDVDHRAGVQEYVDAVFHVAVQATVRLAHRAEREETVGDRAGHGNCDCEVVRFLGVSATDVASDREDETDDECDDRLHDFLSNLPYQMIKNTMAVSEFHFSRFQNEA